MKPVQKIQPGAISLPVISTELEAVETEEPSEDEVPGTDEVVVSELEAIGPTDVLVVGPSLVPTEEISPGEVLPSKLVTVLSL